MSAVLDNQSASDVLQSILYSVPAASDTLPGMTPVMRQPRSTCMTLVITSYSRPGICGLILGRNLRDGEREIHDGERARKQVPGCMEYINQ